MSSRLLEFGLICVSVLAAAGCGGQSTARQKRGSSRQATAAPSPARAARVWVSAVSSGDCHGLDAVVTFPVSSARCRALRAANPRPRLARVGVYGSAATADVTLGDGHRAAAVFILATGRGWRYVTEIGTKRGVVGRPSIPRNAADTIVRRVLAAIGKGSCQAVARDFVHAPKALGHRSSGPSAANCFGHAGSPVAKALKMSVGGPVSLGGNARLAFFGVEFGRGKKYYLVAAVVKLPAGLRFLSYYPAARVRAVLSH